MQLYSRLGPRIRVDTAVYHRILCLSRVYHVSVVSPLTPPPLTPWTRPLRYLAATIVASAAVPAAYRGDGPDLEQLGRELQLVGFRTHLARGRCSRPRHGPVR